MGKVSASAEPAREHATSTHLYTDQTKAERVQVADHNWCGQDCTRGLIGRGLCTLSARLSIENFEISYNKITGYGENYLV